MSFQPARRYSKHIPLSIPHMCGAEMEFIQRAFNANWVTSEGGNINQLEAWFTSHTGLSACALASGTAAIHVGLRLLGVGPGDEVVCPTLTFVAGVNPVRYLGATPVLVDCTRAGWGMDPELLMVFLKNRAAAGKLPKVVTVAHLFGQCADMDAIPAICAEYGVPLLEDAAEAMGTEWRGRPAGVSGQLSAYSFNGNKIVTGSTGGMLIGKDPDAIARARYLCRQARMPELEYVHEEVGYNYRLSNILAGVILGQLTVLPDRVRRRREIAFAYRDGLAAVPGISLMPQDQRGLHTNWLSCFLVDESKFGMPQSKLMEFLHLADIGARPVWKPMHTQPCTAIANGSGAMWRRRSTAMDCVCPAPAI